VTNKSHDLDIDRYDIRKRSPDGVGEVAKSEFVRLLNLERTSVYMIPDPSGLRTIERSVPAKWAVVQVLSKRVNLTLKEIAALLKELGYERRRTALRGPWAVSSRSVSLSDTPGILEILRAGSSPSVGGSFLSSYRRRAP